MSEYVRSVRVMIEIDTNKHTYRFEREGDDAIPDSRLWLDSLPNEIQSWVIRGDDE